MTLSQKTKNRGNNVLSRRFGRLPCLPWMIRANLTYVFIFLQKGWSWKPKLTAPVIDFKTLLNEWKSRFHLDSLNLKSLKSKSSQTETKKGKQIKNLVKSNWLKVAIVSFAFFVSSSYDLISDGLLSHSFIEGTNYTKQINQPDSKLKNKTEKSFIHIVCAMHMYHFLFRKEQILTRETYELFIPFFVFRFGWQELRTTKTLHNSFFFIIIFHYRLACLGCFALQMENIVQKITQPIF